MDYTAIATAIIGGLLGLSGVALFLGKWMPVLGKWIALAKDGVETINDISTALQPDAAGKVELTPEEIAKINADAVAFKQQLAVLLGH